MSNQRIVNSAYFISGIVLFVVLEQLLRQLWAYQQWFDYKILGPIGIPMTVALVGTGLGILFLTRHEKATPFMMEVVEELRQVTWPTSQETRSHTVVVIATVLICAAILGGFDWAWAKMSKLLLNANI